MDSITLTYGSTSRTMNALSVKGFRQLDGLTQNLYQRIPFLDGSVRKRLSGFRRFFEVNLGVVTDADDLMFLGNFLKSETQYLTYTYGLTSESSVRVIDANPEHSSEWLQGTEVQRMVILSLQEANVRTLYPSPTGEGFGYKFGSKFGTRY